LLIKVQRIASNEAFIESTGFAMNSNTDIKSKPGKMANQSVARQNANDRYRCIGQAKPQCGEQRNQGRKNA
jgi:hypothetical protein